MRAIHLLPPAILICAGIAILLILPEHSATRVPFALLDFGLAGFLAWLARRRHRVELAKSAQRLTDKLRPEVSGHLSLSPRLRAGIEQEIAEGEKIVWLVRPDPDEKVMSETLPFVCVITLVISFFVFLMLQNLSEPLHILGGICLILSPVCLLLINDISRARNTACVITDRRAILFLGGVDIWRWGWVLDIEVYPPEKLQTIYCDQNPDCTGNLVFERNEWINSDGIRERSDKGFMRIPNLNEAEKLVRDLAKKAKP